MNSQIKAYDFFMNHFDYIFFTAHEILLEFNIFIQSPYIQYFDYNFTFDLPGFEFEYFEVNLNSFG